VEIKLHGEFPNNPTLDEVVLYMDLDNILIIPHMMKEVLNLKAFIKLYLCSGAHRLLGHTKAQQFWFNIRDDSIPTM
jgi:hypothetical protein